MKLFKQAIFFCLAAVLLCCITACNSDKGGGFAKEIFEADSAQVLEGTGETGGPVNFISRVAAYDLSDPAHVVVRVKLENGFDSCKIDTKTVPAEQVKYADGKLVIRSQFFQDSFTKHFNLKLTVIDGKKQSASIPFIVADKIIYSVTEFQAINSKNTLGGYYVLANDLDFSGNQFTMIGCINDDGSDQTNYPFKGVFEGAGHTISNVTISKPTPDADSGFKIGLFKTLGSGGIIRNLNVKNIRLTTGGGIAGGLVGINSGTVENCYADSYLQAGNYNEPSGGLVGFNVEGAVIQNSIAVTTINGMAFCGGNFGEITNCFAYARPESKLCEIGGKLHAGVENPPYDEGFVVENQFACDMFKGTTSGCELFAEESALKSSEKLSLLPKESWNVGAEGARLYKMFLPNYSAK